MRSDEVVATLRRYRLPLTTEQELQDKIEECLIANGVVYEREKRFSARDRVDFYVNRCAVEVKIKGGKIAIFRQLERYAEHDCVDEIVLVTSVAMGLPAEIGGKPAVIVNLARAWL